MASTISAISYYLPEAVYSNEAFYSDFPEAAGTSIAKVGVKKRHLVADGQTASDMALLAAEKLFAEHGIDRSTIDFLLLSTLEHDYYAPSTACVLHGKLGLAKSCGAIDYGLGCSAYVYGLGMADGIMKSMGAKKVLLLTTSVLSHKFHPKDRSSRFVFGDAASATLLTLTDGAGIGPFSFGTDGTGFDKIIVPDGGVRNPINADSFTETKDEFGNTTSRAHLNMEGLNIFLFSVRTVPPMISDLLQKANLSPEEIDLYVFHQPNVFLNETLRKKMNIPAEKFVHCMEDFGNTVQATIPIALYESQLNGRLKPGMKVVLAGFGAGLSWAATVVQF